MRVEVLLVVVSPSYNGRDLKFLMVERDGGQLALPTIELREWETISHATERLLREIGEGFNAWTSYRVLPPLDDPGRYGGDERRLGLPVRLEVSKDHVKLKPGAARWVGFLELVENQPLYGDHMWVLQRASTGSF